MSQVSYWDRVLTRRVMSRRKALALASSGLAGAALLAACGGGNDDDGSPNAGTAGGGASPGEFAVDFIKPGIGDAVTGGRYRNHLTSSPNFNPVTNWTEGTDLGGKFVYDRPLTSREDERRFVLEAMDSVELVDPLTVVMKIRPDAVYSNIQPVNGRAVEAEDIVATQAYVKETADAFDQTFVNSFLERAEAVDPRTVVYHLKRPAAYLFGGQLLGQGPSQAIIPKETIGPELNNAVQVGSGPFEVAEQRLNINYLYKQSPTYWGRKLATPLPYIDEVEIKFIEDRSALEAAFLGGQLDRWVAEPAQFDAAQNQLSDDYFFYERPGFASVNFSMNLHDSRSELPFRDERIREAAWRLVDRDELAARGYAGKALVPPGLIPASLTPYQIDPADVAEYTRNDVAEAKKLLAAADYDGTTYGIGATGGGNILESVALVVQANLAAGGFNAEVRAHTGGAAFFQQLRDRTWDMLIDRPPGNDTPGQQLRTQHSESWSDIYNGFGVGIVVPEIDTLIEASEQMTDFEENVAAVKEIQRLAMSHYTSSWEVLTHFELRVFTPRVRNFELSAVWNVPAHAMWLKD